MAFFSAIAVMYVHPSIRHWDGRALWSYDADLSLQSPSPMFWAPSHQSIPTNSQPSFSSSTWKRGGVGVWMCKLGEALNANTDK